MWFEICTGILIPTHKEMIPEHVSNFIHFEIQKTKEPNRSAPSTDVKRRAAAVEELIDHGLGPDEMRELFKEGCPRDLLDLVNHMEAYLKRVRKSPYYIVPDLMWNAFNEDESNVAKFYTDKIPTEPIRIGIKEATKPAYLFAIKQLIKLNPEFNFELELGGGEVKNDSRVTADILSPLLRYLEEQCGNFSITTPQKWGENPWGKSLSGLFDGPLKQDDQDELTLKLKRGRVSNPLEAMRVAVNEIVYHVYHNKIEAHEITIISEMPENVGPLIQVMLRAEGIQMGRIQGQTLRHSHEWSCLLKILEGLRFNDPRKIGDGLAGSTTAEVQELVRSLTDCTEMISDDEDLKNISENKHWKKLIQLKVKDVKKVTPTTRYLGPLDESDSWIAQIDNTINEWGLIKDLDNYTRSLMDLGDAWAQAMPREVTFDYMLEALKIFIETSVIEDPGSRKGIRILTPEAILNQWTGSKVTIVLNLASGVWPKVTENPFLDFDKKYMINQTIMNKYPNNLEKLIKTFLLPRNEFKERMPRSFQRAAFGFSKLLALTSEHFLALFCTRNDLEEKASESMFFTSLEGAGDYDTDNWSYLGYRWSGHNFQWALQEHEKNGKKSLPLYIHRQQQFLCIEETKEPREDADIVKDAWSLGSKENPITATILMELTACPFRAFGKRVLRISSIDESPQIIRGIVVHKLIEKYTNTFLRPNPTDLSEIKIKMELKKLFEKPMELWEDGDNSTGKNWFKKCNKIQLEDMNLWIEERFSDLARFLAWEPTLNIPTEEEKTYLKIDDPNNELTWSRTIQAEEEFVCDLNIGKDPSLWFKGYFDRLETMICTENEQYSFNRILDFKDSDKKETEKRIKGEGPWSRGLQTYLYQLSKESCEPGRKTFAYLVPLKGFSGDIIPAWFAKEEDKNKLRQSICNLVEKVGRGIYSATPSAESCEYCNLSAICQRPQEFFDGVEKADLEDERDDQDVGGWEQ